MREGVEDERPVCHLPRPGSRAPAASPSAGQWPPREAVRVGAYHPVTRTGPFAALHGSRWCQTTFQFAEGVLSKRSARTAKHEAPKTDVASARSCEFVASYGLQSAQGRHGPDDGRPATPHDERDAAHRRSEEFGARLHQRLWINFNDPEARHVFGRDLGRLPFRHSPPACSMNRPASGAHSS